MQKQTIVKKTIFLMITAAISRGIAFFREILMLKYLGVGANSDAFYAAFALPNRLRRLFAEGALSSVLIPELVRAKKEKGDQEVSRLTTAAFFCISLFLVGLCLLIFSFPMATFKLLKVQFPQHTLDLAATYLRILISFILFISSASIFAASLQSAQRFFIPAIAPAVLNVMYVAFLCGGLYYGLSIYAFCYALIIASAINLLMHIAAFFYAGYSFALPTKSTWKHFKKVMFNFIPCIASHGCSEINFFIDQSCASSLAVGSYSLLRYAGQFVNIPQSMLIGSFTTVVFPFFSKLKLESHQEMKKQYVEAAKFVCWLTLPISLLMMLFSQKFFQTLFLSDHFTIEHVMHTGQALNMYLIGLLPMAFTRLLLNICYIYGFTIVPMMISLSTLVGDYYLNEYFKQFYGIAGIALATSIMNFVRLALYLVLIEYKIKLHMDYKELFSFLARYIAQVGICAMPFLWIYTIYYGFLEQAAFDISLGFMHLNAAFFIDGLGLWFWVGPLVLGYLLMIYFTRSWFNIKVIYIS